METVKTSLENLAATFHSRMEQYEEKLQRANLTPSNDSASLATDFAAFKTFVLAGLSNVQDQLELLAQDVERLEMRSRRKILLLHGVAEVSDENQLDTFLKIARDRLAMPNLKAEDLSRVQRLGRPSKNKPRPLLMKFRSSDQRAKVWMAKPGLKGSGITMSEFLTKKRHAVFLAARQRYGVKQCWTSDGVIVILGADGTRHRVTSLSELRKVPEFATPIPAAAAPTSAASAGADGVQAASSLSAGSDIPKLANPGKGKPTRSTRKAT